MKVIVDYRICRDAQQRLMELGCKIIKTIAHPRVYREISGHADIAVHCIGSRLIAAPEVYQYYKSRISDYDVSCGSVALGYKYPRDIAYNSCCVGDYVFCNERYTAPEIIEAYESKGKRIVNIKQGYAKCSICVVSDTAVISSDNGVCKSLSKYVDVLKITPGNIDLYGMDGFIGGCSGLIDDNKLAFNGNVLAHPDGVRMLNFAAQYGVETIMLHEGKLQDIGSIIRIDEKDT